MNKSCNLLHIQRLRSLINKMHSRAAWSVALLLAISAVSGSGWAQSDISAKITQVQTDSFPRLRAYLDAHSASSGFVYGLEAGNLRLLEDGQPLQVAEFEALRPGVQAVIAINPGVSLEIRNSQGTSRFDLVRQALIGWLGKRKGSSVDDLSLLIDGGPERSHVRDPQELIAALEQYEIASASDALSLDALSLAMDLAADATPRDGMERAVLFITSPLEGDLSDGVETLISRANEKGIHVNIWHVASQDASDTPAANKLRELAERTGGEFLEFSGSENLPDLESYFRDLRDIYSFSYDSRINSGGVHQLAVEINKDGEVIQLPVMEFVLELGPPEVAFILPPAEIRRESATADRSAPWVEIDPDDLSPKAQRLQVLIDFPDGRPRPMRRTALYVDDNLVAENTSPPYDTFTWDLSEYTTSSQHILQVEVEDELGFTGRSVDTLVQVEVDVPFINPLAGILRRWPALVGLAVLLLGAFLLLGLILGGRVHPRLFGWQLGLRGGRRAIVAPDTQRTGPQSDRTGTELAGRNLSGWINRIHWPQRRLPMKAFAFLTPVTQVAEATAGTPISISAAEVTLGSDPSQAILVIDDLSVGGLHARLTRLDEGGFKISDEGSVAGTWVNYTPVSGEGVVLVHGDLIHIGRMGFRFTQREQQGARKPVIVLLETQT
ncbi:MAG: hypothetical protein A2W36_03940 [Chloroflexi bacterium RBG_16_58_14]|nr:MAG: hypothetical protein A2W36_03940 [Chloroflexi bacterium RBG_16_58_14]